MASATLTPTLTLNQSAGTTAGSSPATGFDANFGPSAGDSVKDVTFALPPGLLANADVDGGACLATTTPTAACQVGTGTLNAGTIPVTEYLVAAPSGSGAVGGLAVVNNATSTVLTTGVATLTATGLDVAFTNLSPGISEMNFTLTDVRLPTSCPTTPANVTISADSQQSATAATAAAPLTVTGCSSLPYAPALTASITKDASDSGAGLVLETTQAADESASKTIVFDLPSGLTPNVGADAGCLNATGCKIGTATATSPLVPSVALANGTLTLTASGTTPMITISFPAPLALAETGVIDLNNNSVTFSNVPDFPLTSLTLNVTGPNGAKAFNTNCAPASVNGTFTAQSGATHSVSAPITFSNCPIKATVSGSSTSGLATGHPKLKFKVVKGAGGANIASVAIVGLPHGLSLSRSALVSHKTCTTIKHKKKCTTTTLIKGLGISGAKAKTVALKHGTLVVTLKKAASSVSFTISGPLLAEAKSLQTKVKKHKVGKLTFSLKITDAKHTVTTVPLKLKAH